MDLPGIATTRHRRTRRRPLWNQGQCQGWNVGLKGSPFLQRDHSIHSPMVPKVSTQVKQSFDSWITWFGVVFVADFHWSRSGSTCKCRERRWQTGQTIAGKFVSIPSSRTGRSSRPVAQESKWKLTRVNSLGWSTARWSPEVRRLGLWRGWAWQWSQWIPWSRCSSGCGYINFADPEMDPSRNHHLLRRLEGLQQSEVFKSRSVK